METKSNIKKGIVSHFDDCEKKVIIVLKNNRVFSSKWFEDDTPPAVKKANCTEKELEIKNKLIEEYEINEDFIDRWYVTKKRAENTVYITRHAEERLKQRNGWNKKTINRMALKIYNEGTTLNKKEHPWAIDMIKMRAKNSLYKLYGNFVYVFQDTTLITVLNIPQNINRKETITT